MVLAVAVELARGDVQGEDHLLAELVAGLLDGAADQVEGLAVAAQIRREAAFVADAGGLALVLEHALERVEDLGATAQALREGGRADRHDHELLHVDVVVGVGAAVDDVHHRDGQDAGGGATDVAIERLLGVGGSRLGDREAGPEDGIGAEAALVGRAVELAEQVIDGDLLAHVEADELVGDRRVHVLHGLADALAAPPGRVAVAELDRLVLTGGSTRRHGRPAEDARFGADLDLDGGVAAAVQDGAPEYLVDGRHGASFGVARGLSRCPRASTG